MAVEQDRGAEAAARLGEQRAQPLVVGMPVGRDPALRLGERQLAFDDGPPLADHPRDHPEPGRDTGVERPPRGAGDQRRVEVVGRAVEIDAGAGNPGGEERRAGRRRGSEQLVDERILGGAELQGPEQ